MKKIPMNTTEDGTSRTILATYHKIGTYNVFEHNFPAVMEVYEDSSIGRLQPEGVRGRCGGFGNADLGQFGIEEWMETDRDI